MHIHQGRCHCGDIAYAFDGVLSDIAHCHCADCRATTGGILTTWITVPRAAFRWLHGVPREYASNATCTRYFCGRCGAQLALHTELAAEHMDVTVATLDEAAQAAAQKHIWTRSRLPWLALDGQLPEEREESL